MQMLHGDMTCVNGRAVLWDWLLVLDFVFTLPNAVTPAKAGVHQEVKILIVMDSRLRGNDELEMVKNNFLKAALFSGRGVIPHRR